MGRPIYPKLSNPLVRLCFKSSCDVHLLRSPWINRTNIFYFTLSYSSHKLNKYVPTTNFDYNYDKK